MERPRLVSALAVALLALAGVGAGAWSLLDRRGAAPLRAEAAPSALEGTRVVVEVLNGTTRRGLARVATRVLREAGFDVVFFGTTGDTVRSTEMLARRGDSTAAARVARALGVGRARTQIDTLRRVDVTVRLGEDYKPPPGVRP